MNYYERRRNPRGSKPLKERRATLMKRANKKVLDWFEAEGSPIPYRLLIRSLGGDCLKNCRHTTKSFKRFLIEEGSIIFVEKKTRPRGFYLWPPSVWEQLSDSAKTWLSLSGNLKGFEGEVMKNEGVLTTEGSHVTLDT